MVSNIFFFISLANKMIISNDLRKKVFVRVSQQIREIGMHKNLNILSRTYLMIDIKGP